METRECHVCRRSVESIFLHRVPRRSAFASLCTGCVLRYQSGSFCPVCFDAYDEDAPRGTAAKRRVACIQCPAVVHFTCLSSSADCRLCPQCSSPDFSFFDFGAVNGSKEIVFTRDLGKQLLCAAKIAAVSMQKVAAMARADAEMKVREALLARKRAVEAIERVVYLMGNEQMQEDSEVDDE